MALPLCRKGFVPRCAALQGIKYLQLMLCSTSSRHYCFRYWSLATLRLHNIVMRALFTNRTAVNSLFSFEMFCVSFAANLRVTFH
jgi:hypothetical protein